jgi:hypothetical protein
MNTSSARLKHVARIAPCLFALMLAANAAGAQPAPGVTAPATPSATQGVGANAGATDIRDIRGPIPLTPPWLIPLVAFAALAAAGGAYAAWAWRRRRARETGNGPLDIALERLEQARLLMVPALGREFSIAVSSAVRDYIESRFTLRAAHLTTDEFLHQLLQPAAALLATHRRLLNDFLKTCDLAKFGGWNLTSADMEEMLQSARQFIVESAADSRDRRSAAGADAPVLDSSTAGSRETHVSLSSA